MQTTTEHDRLRYTKIPFKNGTGAIPALGFGTLIPNPIDTKNATRAALEAGFRQLDSAERYRNEKEVGDAMQVQSAFERQGVTVLTGTTVRHVERNGNGTVELSLDSGKTVVADEILVATGRRPRTDNLGLETVGLEPGSWLEVDDSMRVQAVAGSWLYAAGDVNHRALLTHMGKYQARVCGDAIVARAEGKLDDSSPAPWSRYAATADTVAVPQVIFTEPEVAAVGLTEQQARARGMTVRAVDYDIGRVSGAALYADGYTGQARMVVDTIRNVIVGATLVGPSAGDLLHAATIAIVGAVPIGRLWHAVPAYPTISEIWLRLLETFGL